MSALPSFTVFDIETTGLDPRKHRIIEIAALRIENGVILKENPFVELVNPERTIPWEAAQINNISDDDVRTAPTIETVLPRFLDFAKDSLLIAHHCEFDMGFLRSEKELCWGYIDMPECLCTMKLSQSLYPKEFRHSLDALAMRLGLARPADRHRALPDVLLTAEAFLLLLRQGRIETPEQLRAHAGSLKEVRSKA